MEFLIGRASLILALAPLLSACSSVSYMLQAGMGQWSLYNHERPVEEVLKDPSTPATTKERLSWLPQIRDYVERELKLPTTSNYKTFVDLKRPYVVWSLTAVPAYSLEPRRWSFPIAGTFPYLGFFDEKVARKWEKDEIEAGNDTHVRGVSAYSTIGYLRDPLLSSMLSPRKADMVNLIFHETTHTHFYIKGEVEFDEQAASLIGDAGERKWLTDTFGEKSPEVAEWEAERADRRLFGERVRAFADRLKVLYKETAALAEVERKAKKDEAFARFRAEMKAAPIRSAGWKKWIDGRFQGEFNNNATLVAHLTYDDHQELFESVLQKCTGSIPGALLWMKKFAQTDRPSSGGNVHARFGRFMNETSCQ